MKPEYIPYSKHLIKQKDIDAVVRVLQSDWLTCGPVTEQFEKKLAGMIDAKEVISCSNGTAALHLALLGLELKPEGVVLVPAVTFLASANAARYIGAEVVFVDVDPKTGLMTPETLASAIHQHKDKNLSGIVNVHLGGQCGDLEGIYKLAKQHGLWVVEDAAHALGTLYIDSNGNARPIGANAFSDVSVFSFHPVKIIAAGEGGAISTNLPQVAKRIRLLRSHCMVRESSEWLDTSQGLDVHHNVNPWYYEMQGLGYNYRISDINCALGLNQLENLPEFKAKRKSLLERYDAAFKQNAYLQPVTRLRTSDTAWHLYTLLIDFQALGRTRAQFMADLSTAGIGTQVHYIPVYRQPYYQKRYGAQFLPGAEAYYERCLSLPLSVGIQETQQKRIIEQVLGLCA
jgi:UDP-4-amino-4,6-dideoxy-N-acetyl-beta-L-altrosamine transaminase